MTIPAKVPANDTKINITYFSEIFGILYLKIQIRIKIFWKYLIQICTKQVLYWCRGATNGTTAGLGDLEVNVNCPCKSPP